MTVFPSSHFLADDLYDAADFDLDFDEDYEFLSDEEFNVSIEDYEYELNDWDIPGGYCLDDDLYSFGDFDSSEDPMTENDYIDEAP